ncbi:LysM peptidoglycan-binding domain-containing protein [Marivita sp. S2033]|uniref:LysM peptidoglycan-binding domain-containing protein n=1 Tax=Marivita sp. S2033 TaxID=3373187 RepID=UPI0039829821
MAILTVSSHSALRLGTGLSLLAMLGACSEPLDLDMRGIMNGGFNTSDAARAATAPRPDPDNRGVISYPNYQVAVAQRGDTLATLARRVGLAPDELARYNGIQTGDSLRAGEVIALPRRVAEPSPATGAVTTGPIRPPSEVDITTLASDAIERSDPTPTTRAPQTGTEPVRHQVKRGETAFTISRLYNVSVRSLAEWNGLDSNFTLREGQYLLIPVATQAPPATTTASVAPGRGSPTPEPPSASQPLPAETPAPAAAAKPAATAAAKPVANVGQQTEASESKAAMSFPVQGTIIREYAKGRNDGIDIGASVGTTVKAASSGQVAAITTNTDGINILVVRHPDNLLTVYTHVEQISVAKGDAVSRGQAIARVGDFEPARVHFEVRKGFESVDPMNYLR